MVQSVQLQQPLLNALVHQDWHGLPSAIWQRLQVCELPLAHWIYSQQATRPSGLIIGINGPQGCGKSTTVACLQTLLEHYYGLRVAVISIDDFYLTKCERAVLADRVHPLLITRGVPGTHDITLAINTLTALRGDTSVNQLAVPRFNKAVDDRFPESDWHHCPVPVDVVLFEGWCVGATAQVSTDLATPLNELEQSEDTDGRWRGYVNKVLQTDYQDLFSLLDHLLLFKCADFSWVYQWRKQQEIENARKAERMGSSTQGIMNDQQLKRFILHYERVTRQCQAVLPTIADVMIPLNEARGVSELQWRQPNV